ncbi:response regulator transcription factor [Chitinophagaceae bacterium LB-8]|uniref:Response regulator transcription factor n=1 Tax=Paraflavisolibacter caeni TaxID=2982496 RepID=A0A9X2XV35_9BACT|nr:response regulator transcription factor [Paraflavisolibacter caeni]MCU7549106.1 response regulator transcription factor [Paraflavisolibacter caeni]
METITIMIVDDHTLIREAWTTYFNTNPLFHVIAEAGNGEEAIELVKQLDPDVILMDINLPGMNGIEATEQIRKAAPSAKILAVSLHTQPSYARKIMQKGALGYVTKNSSVNEMTRAILTILNGQKYVCGEIKNKLSEQLITEKEGKADFNSLSTREMEIINYLKKGYSSREIAFALNITIKTVEVHRYNILKKLNLKKTAALVNYINNKMGV